MGSIINSLVGGVSGNTGGAGVNYQAGSANLVNPSTADQASQQYNNAQSGLAQQQNLVNALQGANGINNQSQVYNQLQGVANGTGPNPAQAQLAQATGANTANQAALMAGQRGSSANAGLIARQAAMQGGANQQNASGQAATLQANQSLNALGQLGGLATNQVNQQTNATQAYNNAAQGEQGQILGGIQGQNQAAVGNIGTQNSSNAGVAGQVAGNQAGLIGGALNGIGAVIGKAEGGMVNAAPSNGTTPIIPSEGAASGGAQSAIGKFLTSTSASPSSTAPSQNGGYQAGQAIGTGVGNGLSSLFSSSSGGGGGGGGGKMLMQAEGGKVPAMVSPGEQYIPPAEISKIKAGANPLSVGEKIPGTPKYPGNDYRNDVVPKTLESGGLVIPNKVMQAKDPHKAASDFVAQHLAQNKYANGGRIGASKKKAKK